MLCLPRPVSRGGVFEHLSALDVVARRDGHAPPGSGVGDDAPLGGGDRLPEPLPLYPPYRLHHAVHLC